MRKLFILACLLIFCTSLNHLPAQVKKEVFIEQIEFKLDRISDNAYENEYFMTLKLNKGTTYKFKITNNQENFPGKAVLELLEANELLLTNELNDKYFEDVNFICNKTGFYDILISFQDEKTGYSIIDIFMLQ